MTDICKVCLSTVKISDMAILCDHCDNWIHIKCNNLDKLDYEMLKSTADPWFCISCTSNILPFCNRHGKAKETITPPINLFHHNELFQLIKNLNNLTDESSNDDANSLNVSNKYRDPEYFCNLQGNIKSKSLSIFHHNVCSLSKNFDQLHALLTELDIDFDFIGITESRISKTNFSPTNIALANYVIEQTPTESNAEGALLYINRKHSYKIRKDLKLYKPHKIESVFVEVIMPKRTNIIVGCIYRHPDNNIDEFNTNYLRPLLQKLSKESSKNIFLLGDFNIDLLKFNSCSSVCNFLDELSSGYFMPQIFLSSRITRSSKKLIDNIFCNIPQSSEQNISANLTTTYSDHLPQVRKLNVFIRDWKTFNNATFSANYKSTDWPNVMEIDKGNPNLSFHNNYIEEVEKIISNYAPLRKSRKRELKFQSKPWISSGLQKSIAIKNKLFGKFIKSTNSIIKEKLQNDYKSYRNMISTLLKQSKKNYYDRYFKDNINNMKNTWKGIRSIISLQKISNDSPKIISLEDHTVTDPQTIANTFNNFFCSVATEVQSEVPFSYKT